MTIFDFISLHPWIALASAVVLVCSILIISLIIKYVLKNRNLKLGKGGLSIEEAVTQKVNTRMDEYIQLQSLYDDQRDDINRKIWSVEKLLTMEKYMFMVEERLKVAIRAFKETHESLVISKLPPGSDISGHPDVRRYAFMMRNVYYELREAFRFAMHRNGFTKKDSTELHHYAMDKLDSMYKIVEELIDTDYHSELIPVKELRDAHRAKKPEYGRLIMDIFIEAKAIAVRSQTELDMLKKVKKYMQTEFVKNRNVVTVEDAMNTCFSGSGCI